MAKETKELKELRAQQKELMKLQNEILQKKTTFGRKQQVLDILSDGAEHTITAIGEKLGMSNSSVSSQLSYLKADGWAVCNGKTMSHKKVLLDKLGSPRNLKHEETALQEKIDKLAGADSPETSDK